MYPISRTLAGLVVMTLCVSTLGCTNPNTPAGYVGYVTQGAIFGKVKFYGLQKGPTSTGLGWRLSVINVSVTPYAYTEDFIDKEAVLSRDNLKVGFRVHVVWNVRPEMGREFVEQYSTLLPGQPSDQVVRVAYENFLREPLRTFARDAVQRLNGLTIKERITEIGSDIFTHVQELTKNTPFKVTSVVVGNIQYPQEVEDAVARKMAATQLLEQKQTEIEIEEREKQKRIVQAEGIARAMEIISERLTTQYLQHEAIEAQKAMVNSPNHTTIYIPVGPMGVPLVGTLDTAQSQKKQ